MNVQPTQVQARRPMNELRVGLICALLVSIGPISMAVFTPAMPELVKTFATTEAMVKLTLSFYFAGFAVAQLVCGPLSDGFGRKPVTFGFMTLFLLASVGAILAPNIETLIAARLLQGVGAAVGIAVSRAIVRDLYTSDQSARVMNLIAILMGAGPALSPTVGGVLMSLFGWESVFVFMIVAGLIIVTIVRFALIETVAPDPSRIRPRVLLKSYRELAADRYFVSSSLVLAGGTGAFYTQATILPFILMGRVGLTAVEFGIGMLMQSGCFFIGGMAARWAMRRFGAHRIVPFGFVCVLVGSGLLAVILHVQTPSYLNVMGPVAFYAFGIAFIMPAMATATVAPFPHMAGAASALGGFSQMTGGLAGGLVAAMLGDPVFAMATVIPSMGVIAFASWLYWRTLPEPALARVVRTRDFPPPAE
jgi:DHA1 family bicyclomycin/chloramphenicol resistance-like MFS transporter